MTELFRVSGLIFPPFGLWGDGFWCDIQATGAVEPVLKMMERLTATQTGRRRPLSTVLLCVLLPIG